MVLEVGEEFDHVGWILRRLFGGSSAGRAFSRSGLRDVGVEQMLCGGEACGVFDGVGQAGDVEHDGVGSFFGV